jgi:hypothetical protein
VPPRRRREESSGPRGVPRSKFKLSVLRMVQKAKPESSWLHVAREKWSESSGGLADHQRERWDCQPLQRGQSNRLEARSDRQPLQQDRSDHVRARSDR